ncbi:MAG: hypothetical protein R6W90_03405 [Ignavibacteriaceae bacterium]
MKPISYLIILVFASAILFSACEDSSTDPENGTTENYFPDANGNYYKYTSEITDSNQNQNTGTRSSSYQGTQVKSGNSYQVQIDSITIAGQTFTNIAYFRKSGSGEVLYFVDTTGLAANLPAEYQPLLALAQIDTDLKLYSPNFEGTTTWDVFAISLLANKVIEIKAYYEGKENIPLNLVTGSETKNAVKIRYALKLALPSVPVKEYTARAWFAAGIGVVKWEGNALVSGVFSGNGIDFADSSSVVSQTLIQYSVK